MGVPRPIIANYKFMSKRIGVAILAVLLGPLAHAAGRCPVTLISGTGSLDSVSITFMNAGKLPIRRLEFNCKLIGDRSDNIHCDGENALFFPGMQYTVTYAHQARVPGRVRVLLRSITFADGYVWKPNPEVSCRVLKIDLQKK
jgi:hypothetical protein